MIIIKLYLDNASTTPLSQEVKDYIIENLDIYGNPSSIHSTGEKAKNILDNARQTVSDFIHADIKNVYFTSGGSASNTLGIKGYITRNDCNIYYSPIAHKSIIKMLSEQTNTNELKVDKDGLIVIDDIEKELKRSDKKPFVIFDYANSELGTIQHIEDIINIVHKYNGIVYVDCTGSISTVPLDVKKLDIDMCGFSGHKIGALKGIGVFYKKNNINIEPLIYGNQERGLIGGTENMIGIASLYKAIELYDYSSITSRQRDYVLNYVLNNISDSYLVGSNYRLKNNLYLCIQNIDAESLVLVLDMFGVQVSSGSACNNLSIEPSNVLKAINFNEDDIRSCIRISFSCKETDEELKFLCSTLSRCIDIIRQKQ